MSADGNAVGDAGGSDEADHDRVVAVPCEGDDVLALFALDTGDLLGEVPVGSHPVHATTCQGRTFVATMGERAVTAVAPSGEITRIETGVLGPSHFATANDELFVSCSAGDALAVVDPETLTLVDRIAVGAEPHEVAVSPDGGRLYSGSRLDGVVDVVDPVAHERIGSIGIGDAARVQGVALSPDGGRGYAVDQANARVAVFGTGAGEGESAGERDGAGTDDDPQAARVLATAAVGGDPYDLVVAEDRVFVPGRDDGTVHEFDRDLGLREIHEGFSRPVDLFRVTGDWWVLDADDDQIRSLDGDVIETAAPGLAATRIDDRLVVSHYDADRVSLVDAEAGTVWTADSPEYPFGSVVI